MKPVSISDVNPSRDLSTTWRVALMLVAIALLAFDQWTKWLAIEHLQYSVPKVVFEPWLNWTLVHNRGAAFSFLADAQGAHWFFVAIASLATLVLPAWIYRLKANEALLSVALMLVWCGAIGNLIDRLRFRYVVDFVQVHWYDSWHFAIFNVADACITVGAVLLILSELLNFVRARTVQPA